MTMWIDLDRVQKLEAVKQVWNEGTSAGKIAQALKQSLKGSGPTRQSIIGLYQRNRTLAETHPLQEPAQNRAKKKQTWDPASSKISRLAKTSKMLPADPPRKPVEIKLTQEQINYDLSSRRIPLIEIGRRDCHFPVNSPKPGDTFLFCGHPVEEDKRYCPHHQRRSRIAGTAWKPK